MGATRLKYSSKVELVGDIQGQHEVFVALIDGIPARRHKEPGVWGDDWTVHDLVAHMTAWEQMFIRWYREGAGSGTPTMPAPGYKWNETPRLNRDIQAKHARRSRASVRADFDASYEEVLSLAKRLTEDEMFVRGHFAWTKKNNLASYLSANTASHYRTGSKILRRWLKKAGRD